jgi:hypothetical protein
MFITHNKKPIRFGMGLHQLIRFMQESMNGIAQLASKTQAYNSQPTFTLQAQNIYNKAEFKKSLCFNQSFVLTSVQQVCQLRCILNCNFNNPAGIVRIFVN